MQIETQKGQSIKVWLSKEDGGVKIENLGEGEIFISPYMKIEVIEKIDGYVTKYVEE